MGTVFCIVPGFPADLAGNGRQGFTPFGVEVLHVGGVEVCPLTVQPVCRIAPEGWFELIFFL